MHFQHAPYFLIKSAYTELLLYLQTTANNEAMPYSERPAGTHVGTQYTPTYRRQNYMLRLKIRSGNSARLSPTSMAFALLLCMCIMHLTYHDAMQYYRTSIESSCVCMCV